MSILESTGSGERPTIAVSATSQRSASLEGLQFATVLMDILLVFLSAAASRLIYFGTDAPITEAFTRSASYSVYVGSLLVLFLLFRRSYSVAHLSEAGYQISTVVQGWAFAYFMLGWIAFMFKVTAEFSRAAIAIHAVLGLVTLLAFHAVGARLLASWFAAERLSVRRVALIAGADETGVDRIRRRLARKGIEVVRVTAISRAQTSRLGFPAACRAAINDVKLALASTKVDSVYLFMPWRERRQIAELTDALTPIPVPIYLFADRETEDILSRPQERVGRFHGFEIQRAPLSRADRMMKRALDIAVASVAILMLSPLMLMVSAAILIESGSPVLFRQNRKGFGARPFQILKFRSMTVQENGDKVVQAKRGDTRITRLGAILRKTSIDELPQLFNVLKGDMSIVGPRPHAMAHDDYYDDLIATYAFRQHVKPGITGWAQVSGLRGETARLEQMEARVEHDLWYINHWSITLDIKIILMSAARVLFDRNAY